MNKSTIIILVAVALLHISASLAISNYYGKLAGEEVVSTISLVLDGKEATHESMQDMQNNFNAKIKPTYHLAIALSLPLGPIFKPIQDKWITKPVLSREINKETYKKRASLYGNTLLVLNALLFSIFVLFLWKLVGKFIQKKTNQKSA